jgi:EAL domain-containing protein (putative c-di-GMP-specific phosphodiesterase class I)
MPADELKIDRSLVNGLDKDEGNRYIVRAVIELAHHFGYEVVAEGVETAAVAQALCALGCDSAQGYLFSRPLPQQSFTEWLRAFDATRYREARAGG